MVAEKIQNLIEDVRAANATELYLNYLELEEVPEQVFSLTQLQTLVLTGNQLQTISPDIGRLTQLRTLDLSGNQLADLPDELKHLEKLIRLELASNQLSALPNIFAKMTNLQVLDVYGNQLIKLPASIVLCHNLQEFRFAYNALTRLPANFGKLQALNILDLSFNELQELPPSFFSFSHLKELQLNGNLLNIPPTILSKHKFQPRTLLQAIEKHYQEAAQQKTVSREKHKEKAAQEPKQETDIGWLEDKLASYAFDQAQFEFTVELHVNRSLGSCATALSVFSVSMQRLKTLCDVFEGVLGGESLGQLVEFLGQSAISEEEHSTTGLLKMLDGSSTVNETEFIKVQEMGLNRSESLAVVLTLSGTKLSKVTTAIFLVCREINDSAPSESHSALRNPVAKLLSQHLQNFPYCLELARALLILTKNSPRLVRPVD